MVVHGDVQPSNIFLREKYELGDPLPDLVLGNFEFAFVGQTSVRAGGSPTWQGPDYPKISADTDIWGLGSVIHALAHGRSPRAPMPAYYEELARGFDMMVATGQEEDLISIEQAANTKWDKSEKSIRPLPLLHDRLGPDLRKWMRDYSKYLDHCMKRCLDPDPMMRVSSIWLVQLVKTALRKVGHPSRLVLEAEPSQACYSGDDEYVEEYMGHVESETSESEQGETEEEEYLCERIIHQRDRGSYSDRYGFERPAYERQRTRPLQRGRTRERHFGHHYYDRR